MLVLLNLFLFFLSTNAADWDGCTAILVGKKASVDGSLMTTHTDDCINCDFRLAKVPPRISKAGEAMPVFPVAFDYPRFVGTYRGETFVKERLERGAHNEYFQWNESQPIGSIPQVPETFGYLEGGYPIQNEHQVSFGESTCGANLVSRPIFDGGFALFDVSALARVAAERTTSAREAIQLMGSLAEEYGYYGCEWEGDDTKMEAGEALTVIDPNEAWMFHILPDDTGKSAVWAAQRVPDDHISVVANGFVIKEIDLSNKDYFLASANIYDVARRTGLWNESEPFNFMKVYGLQLSVYKEEYVARRVWRFFDLFAPELKLSGSATRNELPFSVKPSRLVSVQDIMAFNRDHFEGTPYDMTKGLQAGPYGNPNRYDPAANEYTGLTEEEMATGHFERPVSLFRTSYSFVAQTRAGLPDEIGGRVWFGPHSPSGTIYTPFYSNQKSVAKPYQTGSLWGFNSASAFWAHCAVSNWAERFYKYIIEDIQAAQKTLEEAAWSDAERAEQQAAELLKEGKRELAVETLENFSDQNAQEVVSEWYGFFYYLIAKYRDGYKLVDRTEQHIHPQKLFFPKWWLQAIKWWQQPEGDIAYKHNLALGKDAPPGSLPDAAPTSAFVYTPTDLASIKQPQVIPINLTHHIPINTHNITHHHPPQINITHPIVRPPPIPAHPHNDTTSSPPTPVPNKPEIPCPRPRHGILPHYEPPTSPTPSAPTPTPSTIPNGTVPGNYADRHRQHHPTAASAVSPQALKGATDDSSAYASYLLIPLLTLVAFFVGIAVGRNTKSTKTKTKRLEAWY